MPRRPASSADRAAIAARSAPSRSAPSAITRASSGGSRRRQSTTVRSSDVTGTPRHSRRSAGARDMRRRVRSGSLCRLGRTVRMRRVAAGAVQSGHPQTRAADSWLNQNGVRSFRLIAAIRARASSRAAAAVGALAAAAVGALRAVEGVESAEDLEAVGIAAGRRYPPGRIRSRAPVRTAARAAAGVRSRASTTHGRGAVESARIGTGAVGRPSTAICPRSPATPPTQEPPGADANASPTCGRPNRASSSLIWGEFVDPDGRTRAGWANSRGYRGSSTLLVAARRDSTQVRAPSKSSSVVPGRTSVAAPSARG